MCLSRYIIMCYQSIRSCYQGIWRSQVSIKLYMYIYDFISNRIHLGIITRQYRNFRKDNDIKITALLKRSPRSILGNANGCNLRSVFLSWSSWTSRSVQVSGLIHLWELEDLNWDPYKPIFFTLKTLKEAKRPLVYWTIRVLRSLFSIFPFSLVMTLGRHKLWVLVRPYWYSNCA